MNQINFYLKVIFIIFLLLSCEDEKNSRNIFITREVRSEYEFTRQENLRANLGDVIITQLEYQDQAATYPFDVLYDSGPEENKRGTDYAYLTLEEKVTVAFRLDPTYDIEIKLTNPSEKQTYFTLNKNTTEKSVELEAGDYKFILKNNEPYTQDNRAILPVFIQPDREKYDGKEYKSDFYRPQDLFILIAAKECIECNFGQSDSALDSLYLAGCDLRDATFRNSTINSSTFTNTKIGAFEIDPSGNNLLGKTNLLSSRFNNCLMDSVSFYGTQDISFSKFYKTTFYGSDFSRSRGQFVEFENCKMGGSRLDSVSITKSDFFGVNIDYSSIRQSDFTKSRFQFVFIRNCLLDSTNFFFADFQNSHLDYSSLNGTIFCEIEKPIDVTYIGIKSDSSTKCLEQLTSDEN